MFCHGLRWFKKFKDNVNESIPGILNAIPWFPPPELQHMAAAWLTHGIIASRQAQIIFFNDFKLKNVPPITIKQRTRRGLRRAGSPGSAGQRSFILCCGHCPGQDCRAVCSQRGPPGAGSCWQLGLSEMGTRCLHCLQGGLWEAPGGSCIKCSSLHILQNLLSECTLGTAQMHLALNNGPLTWCTVWWYSWACSWGRAAP